MNDSATTHASAVLIGAKAVLIRGPAGSGKSQLVWELLQAAAQGALPFARLVADDRAALDVRSGRLLVRPAPELAGLLEVRGLGIRRLPYENVAVVGVVADLAAADAARLPAAAAQNTNIIGVFLPRLPIPDGIPALTQALAYLSTAPTN
jgi:serine kinase of HPr protein (carbohydrate metabolism regulator)